MNLNMAMYIIQYPFSSYAYLLRRAQRFFASRSVEYKEIRATATYRRLSHRKSLDLTAIQPSGK